MRRLFHVSEESHIATFVPRPPPNPEAGVTGNAVWAIDEAHLPNYMLPRDCPRVTFAEQSGARVIAVEEAWLERIHACQLYLYEFDPAGFELLDAGAGYYIARAEQKPIAVTQMADLVAELAKRNVDFRILPSLWELRDAVAASSLEFSIIRMRNAQPRP